MAGTERPTGGRRRGKGVWAVIGVALSVGVSACSSGGTPVRDVTAPANPAGAAVVPDLSATGSTVPVPTTTPAPATPLAPPPAPGLGPGARGPAVASLEQRLTALNYFVGSVNDAYDGDTAYAVMAFQKVTGLARTGRATDDVIAALNTAKAPAPIAPGGGANRVEIDLSRQVLFLYEGDVLYKILPVSTGNGSRFCSQGACRRAITNTGSFSVYRRASGWETSPLGRLYNSQYFDGGIAIHGSPSVPAGPASHGCVRIPMSASQWFPSHVTVGTPVYVVGSAGAAPPPVVAKAKPSASAPAPAPSPAPVAPTPTAAPPITFVPATTVTPGSKP